jgi:hypothetical protein
MDHALRGEAPPADLLRRAKVELPSGVYSIVVNKAFHVKRDVWDRRLREEALQEVRNRFGALEYAVNASEFETKYVPTILLALTIFLLVLAVSLMVVITPTGSLILALLFTGLLLYAFYHHLHWEPRLRVAVADWRIETFKDHQTQQRGAHLNASMIRQQLYSMTPREFEIAVAGILSNTGYDAQVTDYTSDYGVDAIARKDGKTYVVQIKKYAQHNQVGRPELQKLQGAMLHQMADGMIFVTLGHYSKPAQDYGKQQGILLIDGQELLRMYGDVTPDKPQGSKRIRFKCDECGVTPCYAYSKSDMWSECPVAFEVKVKWQPEEYEEEHVR